MSRFCKQHHPEIQYFTVHNDDIFSLIQYFTLLFLDLTPTGLGSPAAAAANSASSLSSFFGRPIQNTRHFLLESFVWEEAIHVTILWSEDSVA